MGYEAEMNLAKTAAIEAGRYLISQGAAKIDSAKGKDIKLANDKESESIIIRRLSETEIPILSEESGEIHGESEESSLRWIVDPLDGSANYQKGLRELTCVSIALWEGNSPLAGVVYRYHSDELFHGIVGKGAFLNANAIHTSSVRNMKEAILATGFPIKRDYGSDSLNSFVKTVQEFKKIRMLGAAALMGTFVACGRIDAYTENNIMLWDIAAAAAIVSAAGGVVDIELLKDNQCVCDLFANQFLYDEYALNLKNLNV